MSSSSIPFEELPILEALINIRNRLTALKKDSSQYIRAQDVMQIYKEVIKQITKLNSVRDEAAASASSSSSASTSTSTSTSTAPSSAAETPISPLSPSTSAAAAAHHNALLAASTSSSSNIAPAQPLSSSSTIHHSPSAGPSSSSSSSSTTDATSAPTPSNLSYTTSQAGSGPSHDSSPLTNRVDTTLNDVFALLSLFFLTIGKSRESPALFSQLSCMKQLLDHLAESGIYTESDLKPFANRLKELREIIIKDGEAGRSPVQLTKLMLKKLEGCERCLNELNGTLSVLSVELLPIHQRLINVRRQIAAAAAKPKPARTEIKLLQEELRKIDSKRVDGKFLGPGGSSVPAGQAILVGILEECFEICHDITVRNDEVPMELQPIYDRLVEIKAQLEHLVLTHRWTLRETDLWNYQVSLKEIDRLRVNGKFVDSEGKQPEGQLVLLYLLRRCYGLIYRLVASSEPISEELMPISNKLSTVQKCLKEVSKYGGPFTMRDLYPYRLALHQIDSLRTVPAGVEQQGKPAERKWLGRDGNIPEGQAILKAQYEEVEQTIEEMLNREDDDDDEDDEEYEDGDDVSEAESDTNVDSSLAAVAASVREGRAGVGGNGASTSTSPAGSKIATPASGGTAPGEAESALASPTLNLASGFSTPGFAPIQPWGIQTFTSQGQQAAAAAAAANGLSRPPLKGTGPWSTFGSQASGISSTAGSVTGGGTSVSGSNVDDAFHLSDAAISPTPTGAAAAAADVSVSHSLPQTETVTAASSGVLGSAATLVPSGPSHSASSQTLNPNSVSAANAEATPVARNFPPGALQAPVSHPPFLSVSPDRGLPHVFTASQALGTGSIGGGAVSGMPLTQQHSGSQISSSGTPSSVAGVSSNVTSPGEFPVAGGVVRATPVVEGAAPILDSAVPSSSAAPSAAAAVSSGGLAPESASSVDSARMMESQRSASERTLVPNASGLSSLSSSSVTASNASTATAAAAAAAAAPAVVDKADAAAQTDAEPPAASSEASDVEKMAASLKDSVKIS